MLRSLTALSVLALSLGLGACAAPVVDAPVEQAALSATAQPGLSDAEIARHLGELIEGAQWMSESDYGYTVIEGDGVGLVQVNEAAVRKRLAAALEAKSEDRRNIRPASVRGVYVNVDHVIEDFEAEANDADADEYMRTNARKLSASLRFMKANLTSVVGFTFGTNASGDGDGQGNVLYVYVGLSASGKLIGMFTEAVYT